MTYLSLIQPHKSADISSFIPVHMCGGQVGWTPPHIAALFDSYDDTWNLDGKTLSLNDKFKTFEERTRALDATFIGLAAKGQIQEMPDYTLFGTIDWYPVRHALNTPPLAIVKRFYSRYIGIKFESVMLHGYHNDMYWVAERSAHVHDDPGKLDIMSAGSMTYGDTVTQTLAHEALSEASLEPEDLQKVVKTDCIEVFYLDSEGLLKNEVFHIFDLDTDDVIVPKTSSPIEVAGFNYLPISDIVARLQSDSPFKKLINPVVIDFLIRHGHIPTSHPEYHAIKELLAKPFETALSCAA